MQPSETATPEALRAEAQRIQTRLDGLSGLRSRRDAAAETLNTLRRQMPAEILARRQLQRWAALCGAELVMHAPRQTAAPPPILADGLRRRPWTIHADGPAAEIACFFERVIGEGRLFAVERLHIESHDAGARGVLSGIEWSTAGLPDRPRPTPVDRPTLPADADVRVLAEEVTRLRRLERDVIAPLEAEAARFAALAERTTETLTTISATAWHASALDAFRRMQPLDGTLTLTPTRGVLGGALLAAEDHAFAAQLTVPSGVTWSIEGLRPARQSTVKLPAIAVEGEGPPRVKLDAVDAPAAAVAVLLGGAYLNVQPTDGPRFTGRIDAPHPREAAAAVLAAVPALADHALSVPDDGGERVTVQFVDVDSRQLDALLAEVAGRPLAGCPAGIGVTLGARDVSASALSAALAKLYAADPRCTSAAPAPPTLSAPPDEPPTPRPDWRLALTLRDGTTRTALFEAADGRLHLFHDRGAWDDVFLRFERARAVLPGPTVHVLEPRR